MTQEEKQLLLKDLCARLPYGVICRQTLISDNYTVDIPLQGASIDLLNIDMEEIEIKPYLRPLSSMTEDEKNELNKHYLCITIGDHIILKYHSEGYWDNDTETEFKDYLWLENWFNEHHFDYRIDPSTGKTLIESNLAIEAPEGMYEKF